MPLPPPPSGGPGGILHLEYSNPSARERHSLHLHLCWFDSTPLGASNDRAYTTGGPTTPAETHVSDTYAALAELWQPYYESDWVLQCQGLYYNLAGIDTILSPAPDFPVHAGTNTLGDPTGPRFDRRFRLLGRKGAVRHLHISQVAGTQHRPVPFEVSTGAGGMDARDRELLAYLSGTGGGGVVTPDGTYCFPVTDMLVLWARSVGSGWPDDPGAPYLVTG